MIGKNIAEIEWIPAEDRQRIIHQFEDLLIKKHEIITINRIERRVDGIMVRCRWRNIPIVGADGEVVEVKCVGEVLNKAKHGITCGGVCQLSSAN